MPPKKNQKMSIQDFLADTTTGGGSWADDIDDLPSAPTSRDDRGGYSRPSGIAGAPDRSALGYGGGAGGGFGADRGGDRGWPAREELPLPTRPPFTAFVGNLAFEVTEMDIAEFFAPAVAVSIRLISGPDGKPKGFGYIEFETLDGLKEALSRSGTQMGGRGIRVSVAEPPKEGFGGRRGGRRGDDDFGGPSAAEEASQWRRAGPLPPADPSPAGSGGYRGTGGPGGPRRGDSFLSAGGGDRFGPSGFDNMGVNADGSRAGFGSKFSSSAGPSPSRGASFGEDPALGGGGGGGGPGSFRRGSGEPRALREPVEPGPGDVANDWRTGKAVSGPPAGAASSPSGGPRRGSSDRAGFGAGAAGPGAEGGARTPQLRRRESSNVAASAEIDAKYSGAGECMGFGSKFSPSPAPAAGAASGGDALLSPTGSASAESPAGPTRRPSKFGAAGANPDGEASNWRTAPRKQPAGSAASAAAGEAGSGATSPAGGSSSTPAAPAERKRLELKPRSSAAVLDAAAAAAAASPSTGGDAKSSPFGAAKPVNAAEREREIEERLAAKREEERKEREAKRAEERERKAAASAAATTTTTAAGAGAGTGKGGNSNSSANGASPAAAAGATTGAEGKKEAAATAADPAAASELANGSAAADGSAAAAGADAPAPPPPTPRVPPPTGAWGGGRKASGALAKGSGPAAGESASLEAVTEGVANASVKEDSASASASATTEAAK